MKEVIRIGNDEKLVSEAKRKLDDLERMVRKDKGFNLDTYVKNNEIYNKAFSALERRDFREAISKFRRVLDTDPKHVQSWGNLGIAYAALGKRTKALECLDKALEIDPKYEPAQVNRMAIEDMIEGEPLLAQLASIDYSRDSMPCDRKTSDPG